MIRSPGFSAALFMILLVIATVPTLGQDSDRAATLGVLGIVTKGDIQYANLMDINERDPKTNYHYMYRLFCGPKCPVEDGRTYPALIHYGTHIKQLTFGRYKLKVIGFIGNDSPLFTDGVSYKCPTPLPGGHWESSPTEGLICKPGKDDHIKWKAAKPTETYGTCNEQNKFANTVLNVTITVKPGVDMAWKFDEAPSVIANRIVEGLNKNGSNIKFQEASGVTPNLFLKVTAVETNEGTRQDSFYVEVTGMGKSGILFRESSGKAPFTDWVQAVDKLTVNMNIWFENGWSNLPCVGADGFLRMS